ncbi:Hypothetical_protein [Hexamita inflata]|uniref:Hypothetical_protein n=1 Tax=Hexamita inflata TaxID=28002 RepID=A0AA86R0I3_9EUKA|nr:Hypothetical protein HINF_LOCUS30990 [Hexamita inflata]CAI9963453.1 Hypothetical protein HINF_LOCUS51098 [Hexamita inflata]
MKKQLPNVLSNFTIKRGMERGVIKQVSTPKFIINNTISNSSVDYKNYISFSQISISNMRQNILDQFQELNIIKARCKQLAYQARSLEHDIRVLEKNMQNFRCKAVKLYLLM